MDNEKGMETFYLSELHIRLLISQKYVCKTASIFHSNEFANEHEKIKLARVQVWLSTAYFDSRLPKQLTCTSTHLCCCHYYTKLVLTVQLYHIWSLRAQSSIGLNQKRLHGHVEEDLFSTPLRSRFPPLAPHCKPGVTQSLFSWKMLRWVTFFKPTSSAIYS